MCEKLSYEVNEVLNIFRNNYNRQVILYGPPGTSKTYSSKIIAANFLKDIDDITTEKAADEYLKKDVKDKFKIIQFHPSYNYDDFVRGIKMSVENGTPKYETVNKVFGAFAREAEANKNSNYVLIIDEINRAPLASVLGELIYGLEYRDSPIDTPYKLDNAKDDSKIIVPSNLYVIGTMNTADRSIGTIDYAVRRRFAFVPVYALNPYTNEGAENPDTKNLIVNPDTENLIVNSWGPNTAGKTAFTIYKDLYDVLEKPENWEDPDIEPRDLMIGHTYFLGGDTKEKKGEDYLEFRWKYQVIPILEEYVKDGLLKKDTLETLKKCY